MKKALVELSKRRFPGHLAARVCRWIGAEQTSRKISLMCNYVPKSVRVDVPAAVAWRPNFVMDGFGGLDQVARVLWWRGWDSYERPFPSLFAALSRRAQCVFDIGAYTGFYSMLAASCSRDARIVAFEPFPPVRDRLSANLRRNGLTDRVAVSPLAMGDQSGRMKLYVPTTKTGLLESASSLNPEFRASHLETIDIEVGTLDTFCASLGAEPDLIKLDVESFEPRVLRGADGILRRRRPVIFLEILQATDCEALEQIRTAHGYICGVLRDDSVSLAPRVSFVPKDTNQVLIPSETLDSFREMAAIVSVRVE